MYVELKIHFFLREMDKKVVFTYFATALFCFLITFWFENYFNINNLIH